MKGKVLSLSWKKIRTKNQAGEDHGESDAWGARDLWQQVLPVTPRWGSWWRRDCGHRRGSVAEALVCRRRLLWESLSIAAIHTMHLRYLIDSVSTSSCKTSYESYERQHQLHQKWNSCFLNVPQPGPWFLLLLLEGMGTAACMPPSSVCYSEKHAEWSPWTF